MAFNFNGNTPKKILYNGLNVAKLVYNEVVVWMSKVLATISGILPLTLTDCTGDDLVDYKIYGNSEYEGLPDGYTQVEYLESTGTQYINTGVNLSNNSNVEINAKLTATQRDKNYYLFGSSIENKRYMIAVGSFTNKYLADFVSSSYRIESSFSAFDGKFHTHKATNLSYYIDEILQGSTSSSTFTNTSSAYIFDVRDRGASARLGTQSWKIKYCKIWDGNNLIRNFIPCINSSNVAGMYDTVNDVFYANAGTGTFNVGAVVSKKSVGDLVTDTSDVNYGKYKIPILTNSTATYIYLNKPLRKTSKLPIGYTELEHIRSTGTQWIDTGVKSNSNLNLTINFEALSNKNNSIFGSRASDEHNQILLNIYRDQTTYVRFNTGITLNRKIFDLNTQYDASLSKNGLYVNNQKILSVDQSSFSDDGYTMPVFAFRNSTTGDIISYGTIKLYSFFIKENDILVRNFIPCKNPSNVIGLYDTVNDVFYTNAGSGSFIAGAEVETVYYTDYLDYENQKVVRNVDDNDKGLDTPVEESVVLPAVATDEGTVTVDVDTEIAPSNMEVVYYKNG